MRITCETLEDFLENLSQHEVYQRTIWVNRTRKHTDLNDAVFLVSIDTTAAILRSDGSDALVQYGEHCDLDMETADGHSRGTEKQKRLFETLQQYAEKNDLKLLPGILSE